MTPSERKALPIYSGVIAYFPLALLEVARVSKVGNDQHNPGEPLHWARDKSTDQLDSASRHIFDHAQGVVKDNDNTYHLAKAIWRLCAELQLMLEWQREYDARVANGEDEIRGHTYTTWVRKYKTTSAAKFRIKEIENERSHNTD